MVAVAQHDEVGLQRSASERRISKPYCGGVSFDFPSTHSGWVYSKPQNISSCKYNVVVGRLFITSGVSNMAPSYPVLGSVRPIDGVFTIRRVVLYSLL
jgi:hypothetical protein